MKHYIVYVDQRCRLVVAQRTHAPFAETSAIDECFREIEGALKTVPRGDYVLLVDARNGPARNDPGFEAVMATHRGKLLFGFARNAALAATAAGRLQIQRYARDDGRHVFATDDPRAAFDYLGVADHPIVPVEQSIP